MKAGTTYYVASDQPADSDPIAWLAQEEVENAS